jgi:CRISPR-associated protein Cas6
MTQMEIKFGLQGKSLPADHGYPLYSAIKNSLQILENPLKNQILLISETSEDKSLPREVLISSISGNPNGNKVINLNQRFSSLTIRCPTEQVRAWYSLLQNQVLDVRGHLIRLVQPRLGLIQPSHSLKARLVIFKLESIDHAEVPKYFLESCQKSLERLEISAQVYIDSNDHGDLARRSLQIKHKHIVGYGVVVEGLSDEDSITLQSLGIGGRKHFGCGWFYPVKELGNEK